MGNWGLRERRDRKKRPTEFKSAPGSENFANVHKRVKK
jgi:hypothetical protein